MRICRFDDNRLGVATQDGIHDVTDIVSGLPSWTYPLPVFDPFIARLPEMKAKLQERVRKTRQNRSTDCTCSARSRVRARSSPRR